MLSAREPPGSRDGHDSPFLRHTSDLKRIVEAAAIEEIRDLRAAVALAHAALSQCIGSSSTQMIFSESPVASVCAATPIEQARAIPDQQRCRLLRVVLEFLERLANPEVHLRDAEAVLRREWKQGCVAVMPQTPPHEEEKGRIPARSQLATTPIPGEASELSAISRHTAASSFLSVAKTAVGFGSAAGCCEGPHEAPNLCHDPCLRTETTPQSEERVTRAAAGLSTTTHAGASPLFEAELPVWKPFHFNQMAQSTSAERFEDGGVSQGSPAYSCGKAEERGASCPAGLSSTPFGYRSHQLSSLRAFCSTPSSMKSTMSALADIHIQRSRSLGQLEELAALFAENSKQVAKLDAENTANLKMAWGNDDLPQSHRSKLTAAPLRHWKAAANSDTHRRGESTSPNSGLSDAYASQLAQMQQECARLKEERMRSEKSLDTAHEELERRTLELTSLRDALRDGQTQLRYTVAECESLRTSKLAAEEALRLLAQESDAGQAQLRAKVKGNVAQRQKLVRDQEALRCDLVSQVNERAAAACEMQRTIDYLLYLVEEQRKLSCSACAMTARARSQRVGSRALDASPVFSRDATTGLLQRESPDAAALQQLLYDDGVLQSDDPLCSILTRPIAPTVTSSASNFVQRLAATESGGAAPEKSAGVASETLQQIHDALRPHLVGVPLFAVLYCGNHQYKVSVGDVIAVQRLRAEISSEIAFKKILCVGSPHFSAIGRPFLKHCRVVGVVEEQKRMRNVVSLFHSPGRRQTRWVDAQHAATIIRIRQIAYDPHFCGELDKYNGKMLDTFSKDAHTNMVYTLDSGDPLRQKDLASVENARPVDAGAAFLDLAMENNP